MTEPSTLQVPDIQDGGKALFIVDIQPATLNSAVAATLPPAICAFIEAMDYDCIVIAAYEADKDSMFFKQGDWLLPFDEAGGTAPSIVETVRASSIPFLQIRKNTRSCFKCREADQLQDFLERLHIRQIHIVGCDINDCVLAMAFDAIDRGYFTFVIEELAEQYDGDPEFKNHALNILRRQSMTNNSAEEKFTTRTVSF